MLKEKLPAASLESSKPKNKEFKSPHAMTQWQWRSILEELGELQRHLSDPSCPCVLADSGEYCGQKHALGLHTLAKETLSMVGSEYTEMLEQLAEEALDQHNALNSRITCDVHDPLEKDTVLWARQWRKKIEPIYYHAACQVKPAKLKQDVSSCTLMSSKAELEARTIAREQLPFDFDIPAAIGPRPAPAPAIIPPTTPAPGTKYRLFPFQAAGYEWLKGRSFALLADDMGLGKTPQAIYWGADFRPNLVIVPAALTFNWVREISEMWRPNDTVILLDGKTELPRKLPDWTVMSYGMVPRYLQKIKRAGFKALIIDEAHLVKNLDTARTKSVLELVAPEESAQGDRIIPNRLAITGTPVLNRPIELFALLVFLGVKKRDDLKEFLTTYTVHKVYKGRMIFTGAKNLSQLHSYLQSFMLRRLKKDVLKELPPKTNTPMFVAITNAAEYREAENHFLEWLREKSGDEAAMNASKAEIITRMNSLRQLAAIGKVAAVCDWLKPCTDGQGKVIVFSSFLTPLEQIKHCQPSSVVYTGADSSKERQIMVDKFQEQSDVCYFLGTVGAAGVGITLTAASRVAFLDLPWTPGGKAQAEDRAHRIGQTMPVEIVNILARGTIDERMLQLLNEKEYIIAQAIDGKTKDEAISGSVSNNLIQSFISAPSLNQTVMQYEPEEVDPTPYAVSFDDLTEIAEGFRQDKQPWQMTKVEYSEYVKTLKPPEGVYPVKPLTHKQQITIAVGQGKPVPAEVLKDYPDLVNKVVKKNAKSDSASVRVTGKCDTRDTGSCQFTVTKKGKPQIVRKEVKTASSVKCAATGVAELVRQKSSLINTGKCFIKKKARLKHPINKFISGIKLSRSEYEQIWDDANGFQNCEIGQGWGGIGGLTDKGVIDYFDGWRDEIIEWYKKNYSEVIEAQARLCQEPTAVVAGTCSAQGCNLTVKGKVETPAQATGAGGITKAVDSVMEKLERRGGPGETITNKTFAPGISTNTRYEFQFAVKEASDLIVSHDPFTFTINPKYTAKLQPRQRERLANQSQVRTIAAGLDPDKLLLDTKAIDTGCPIINAQNFVLCGNGRVMALVLAEAEHPANIVKYKLALRDIAPKYNLPVEAISKMKLPVLVRILLTKTNEQAFAEECNARPTIEASAIEKARTDADKITTGMLNSLDVLEGEAIEDALRSGRNKQFVTAFLSKLPSNEQALLVDAKGSLNTDGVRRMGMAIFVATFKGDAGLRLAAQFFEALDTNVKNAFNGILRALGGLAQAENLVAAGDRNKQYAFGEDMAKAVNVFSVIKKTEGMTVETYLAQSQMIERELTPFQERVLQVLDEYSRSAKHIGEILSNYAQAVIDSPPPGQSSMMGDIRATKEELFENAVRAVRVEVEIERAEAAARRQSRETSASMSCPACTLLLSPSPEKLRALADSMQADIDSKRDPGVSHQNVTARRARQAAGMSDDADRLEEVQTALRGMADAMAAGTLPAVLDKVSNRAQVEQILHGHYSPPEFHKSYIKDLKEIAEAAMPEALSVLERMKNRSDNLDQWQVEVRPDEIPVIQKLVEISKTHKNEYGYIYPLTYLLESIRSGTRLQALGIYDKEQFERAKEALKSYVSGPSPEVIKAKELKAMETKLIGTKIPGFFPTPRWIIDTMIIKADIQPGMRILEPSAGKGDIADAIKEQCPDCLLFTIEYNSRLVDILHAKGYNTISADFLGYYGIFDFDRIIMNPPFENEQDIDHVRHAFDLLKPGGRIVAIMGEHAFFANDKKAIAFREWLDELGGDTEQLCSGSFSGEGAFCPTGVATRIVTVDKSITQGRAYDPQMGDIVEYRGEQWEVGFVNRRSDGSIWNVRLQKSGDADARQVKVTVDELRFIRRPDKDIPGAVETSYQPGQQIKLFDNKWLAKKLTDCNLSDDDLDVIFGWKPLRDFIAWLVSRKEPVNVCAIGMVPGVYEIVIIGIDSWDDKSEDVLERAKKVPGIKKIYTRESNLVFTVLVPEDTEKDLTWAPQEVSARPAKREPSEQAAMFAQKAHMQVDPILTAIGCTIGVGCMASKGQPAKHKKPVCSAVQETKRESCIIEVKGKIPSGCNAKEWNKPADQRRENCVNPWAICTKAVGCRVKRKK